MRKRNGSAGCFFVNVAPAREWQTLRLQKSYFRRAGDRENIISVGPAFAKVLFSTSRRPEIRVWLETFFVNVALAREWRTLFAPVSYKTLAQRKLLRLQLASGSRRGGRGGVGEDN